MPKKTEDYTAQVLVAYGTLDPKHQTPKLNGYKQT